MGRPPIGSATRCAAGCRTDAPYGIAQDWASTKGIGAVAFLIKQQLPDSLARTHLVLDCSESSRSTFQTRQTHEQRQRAWISHACDDPFAGCFWLHSLRHHHRGLRTRCATDIASKALAGQHLVARATWRPCPSTPSGIISFHVHVRQPCCAAKRVSWEPLPQTAPRKSHGWLGPLTKVETGRRGFPLVRLLAGGQSLGRQALALTKSCP